MAEMSRSHDNDNSPDENFPNAPPEFYLLHGMLDEIVRVIGRLAARSATGMGDDLAALKRRLDALWTAAHDKK
jgi:hypothetical protein